MRKHGEQGTFRGQTAVFSDVQKGDRRARFLVGNIENDDVLIVPAALRFHRVFAHLEELATRAETLQIVVADRRKERGEAVRDASQRAAGQREEEGLADLHRLVDFHADGEIAIEGAALFVPVDDRLQHGEMRRDGSGDVADHLVQKALGLRALMAEYLQLAENKAGIGRTHQQVEKTGIRRIGREFRRNSADQSHGVV